MIKQPDSNSCGVCVCMVAASLVLGKCLPEVAVGEMSVWRRWVAARVITG